MAQWLRICLPMQGTQVQSLVGEDPTFHGATKPEHCNYEVHVPQPKRSLQTTMKSLCIAMKDVSATTKILQATNKTQTSQMNK